MTGKPAWRILEHALDPAVRWLSDPLAPAQTAQVGLADAAVAHPPDALPDDLAAAYEVHQDAARRAADLVAD